MTTLAITANDRPLILGILEYAIGQGLMELQTVKPEEWGQRFTVSRAQTSDTIATLLVYAAHLRGGR